MTIKEALREANALIKQSNLNIYEGDAELLMGYITGKSKEFLHINPETLLTDDQKEKFFEKVHHRIQGVPVAHLTGHKEFYGIDFMITKDVLIPRPETEILVQEALSIIKSFPTFINVADIGTGSGCIAISILKHSSNIFRMYATDISKKALQIAKLNAERHEEIMDRIIFLRGSLLDPIGFIPIEVLIANLPYISYADYQKNQELKQEPIDALTDKKDGLYLYRELFDQLSNRPQMPYWILLEIGHNQASEIREICDKYFVIKSFEVIKDLAGHDRVIKISL